jgi:dTDP-4-dehydrorhamnose reductase
LFGASGLLGFELSRALRSLGTVVAPSTAEVDVRQSEQVAAIVRQIRPAIIVNAVAWTDVDAAEQNQTAATLLNVQFCGQLVECAKTTGALLVHFSSDYVFSGAGTTPWRETDCPQPVSVYGKTKFEADQLITQSDVNYLIFRVSWLYGWRRRNFLLTFLRLALTRHKLQMVSDQIGAPTPVWALADAITGVLASYLAAPQRWRQLYHLSAGGESSWFGFATEILRSMPALGMKPLLTMDNLQPINTADYPSAAKRPLNSRLDCNKIAIEQRIILPDWQKLLSDTFAQLPSLTSEQLPDFLRKE